MWFIWLCCVYSWYYPTFDARRQNAIHLTSALSLSTSCSPRSWVSPRYKPVERWRRRKGWHQCVWLPLHLQTTLHYCDLTKTEGIYIYILLSNCHTLTNWRNTYATCNVSSLHKDRAWRDTKPPSKWTDLEEKTKNGEIECNKCNSISYVTSLTCVPPVRVLLQEWSNIHLCVHVADTRYPLLSHDLQVKIKQKYYIIKYYKNNYNRFYYLL